MVVQPLAPAAGALPVWMLDHDAFSYQDIAPSLRGRAGGSLTRDEVLMSAAARLSALSQLTTEIDGVEVRFIHVPPPHRDALPLMTHGWPGSVVGLLDVVGPLVDPPAHGGSAEGAFDLVLPSPETASRGQPAEVGWDAGAPHRPGPS